MHQIDLFDGVRRLRADFASAWPDIDEATLNHGVPTHPAVEYEADMPAPVEHYLAKVLGAPGPKVTNFVRMGSKVRSPAALAPESVLAWPVRDPREVVRSHLLGRDGRTAHRYPTADDVFAVASKHDPWPVRRLSEALIAEGPVDFGERPLRLRHEDLCADPGAMVTRLYERLGGVADSGLIDWCRGVVRVPEPWEHADDPRWTGLFERDGAADLVADLGYV